MENEEKVDKVKSEVVGIRNDLVSTAVKFLENTKVQSTSEDVRRTFLKKKGLTDEEIKQAFSLVRPQHDNQVVPVPAMIHVPQQQTTSQFGSSIRDFLNLVLLIGGASYGLRYLWKNYISPWLFGHKIPSPSSQAEELCKTVVSAVDKIQTSLQRLTEKLDTHVVKIDQLLNRQESIRPDSLKELKEEIHSVKGLLLSRARPEDKMTADMIFLLETQHRKIVSTKAEYFGKAREFEKIEESDYIKLDGDYVYKTATAATIDHV